MLELLQFVLSSPANFIGTVVLMLVSSVCLSVVVSNIRLFNIQQSKE